MRGPTLQSITRNAAKAAQQAPGGPADVRISLPADIVGDCARGWAAKSMVVDLYLTPERDPATTFSWLVQWLAPGEEGRLVPLTLYRSATAEPYVFLQGVVWPLTDELAPYVLRVSEIAKSPDLGWQVTVVPSAVAVPQWVSDVPFPGSM